MPISEPQSLLIATAANKWGRVGMGFPAAWIVFQIYVVRHKHQRKNEPKIDNQQNK